MVVENNGKCQSCYMDHTFRSPKILLLKMPLEKRRFVHLYDRLVGKHG